MAILRFRVLGRPVAVECRRDGKRLLLCAEGRELAFVPEREGPNGIRLRIDDRTVTAWIARQNGTLWVAVEGEAYRFDLEEAEAAASLPDAGGVLEPGSHLLKVPLPGTVAKILVGEGERVERNQPLVVVEAMKMENAVFSPVVCTIGRVHVAEGDVVNLGDPLVEMIV